MTVEFQAEIKELKQRTGVDAEKTGRLVLEFVPTDKTIIALSTIYKPGEIVYVSMSDGGA